MQCDYFDAQVCGSCTLMGTPYEVQLREKERRARELVGQHESLEWLESVRSPESGFRNKAKLVVGGSAREPTLGILGSDQRGVDLTECGLYPDTILRAMPGLKDIIRTLEITPYDVRRRRGELKNVIVTVSPDHELMIRFVLRSKKFLVPLKRARDVLLKSVPGARVLSVNILREHQAVLEGPEEIILTEEHVLPMRVNGVPLLLRPQGFFQTNTRVAAAMYEQAARWFVESDARTLTDLYCGVGGFALHAALRDRRPGQDPQGGMTGIEISADAVRAATQSAENLGLTNVTFREGNAGEFPAPGERLPEMLVVNPPRRGLGAEFARRIEDSGIPTVIYSSCHATTLARDLAHMPTMRPCRARVFDMFPQTNHYETMVLLRRG